MASKLQELLLLVAATSTSLHQAMEQTGHMFILEQATLTVEVIGWQQVAQELLLELL